jgi:trehalose synthase
MLPLVNVGHKSLADYTTIATRGLMDEIRRLAEPLEGKRVVHLSATAFGGGVAEINYTLIPLMSDAGLDVEWRIIRGQDEFFDVTKTIHNALQGDPRGLTPEQQELFHRYNAENARELDESGYDYVIIHDPQPVAMIEHFEQRSAKWVWRGHIDFSTPNPQVLDVLLPSIRRYDAAIFHLEQYVPRADGLPTCVIWPPAIDPLAPKNMALSPEDAAYIVDQFGIDVERPLITQVSRFDPWKDPLGVIDAYRVVKKRFPEVQLALVGSMAHDDPEGWDFYNRTVEHADGDPDIFILSNLNNVGSVEVNAFQVHSSVVIQKSIREGFGLTVSEALWKGRPMVAGRVGGIVVQIEDGETGWLVDSAEQCGNAIIEALRDPVEARTRALRGKEHVRRNFLTPRLLRDWLALFNALSGNETGGVELHLVEPARA